MKALAVTQLFCAAGLLALTTTATQAQLPSEVEGARANARAGGPTNSHDADLLRRFGALTTGTPYRPRYGRRHHRR